MVRPFIAALVVSAIAATAAAQTGSPFRHPHGWSLTVPAGISTPADSAKDETAAFMLTRAGATVAVCVVRVTPLPQPVTAAGWDQVNAPLAADPAGTARRYSERNGHAFVSLLGGGPVRAAGGWNGHEVWYERTNKTSGQRQTAYNLVAMVDAGRRAVSACHSLPGFLLDPAEIQRIRSLNASIRP